jgi:hypothetical protein
MRVTLCHSERSEESVSVTLCTGQRDGFFAALRMTGLVVCANPNCQAGPVPVEASTPGCATGGECRRRKPVHRDRCTIDLLTPAEGFSYNMAQQ